MQDQEPQAVSGGSALVDPVVMVGQVAHGVDVTAGHPGHPGVAHARAPHHAEHAQAHADIREGGIDQEKEVQVAGKFWHLLFCCCTYVCAHYEQPPAIWGSH